MVICVRCGGTCVVNGGYVKFIKLPEGSMCMDCFYQTPEGREWIERGRRLAAGLPLAAPKPAAEVVELAAARRKRRR